MKKILSMVLALALTLSLGTTALAAESGVGSMDNFKSTKMYSNQFTDVKSSDYFYNGVKLCYEMNIMNGTSATTFNPSGNVTEAQLTIIAARLYNIYYGGTGEIPYYSEYPNLDLGNRAATYLRNALGKENVSDMPFVEPAQRWALGLFGQVLPDTVFTPINSLSKVPDVASFPTYYAKGMEEQVLKLYNAGIIAGSDEYGTFYNNSYITRGAVAAIVARIVDPSQRQTLNLKEGKPAIVGVANIGFNDCPNMQAFYEENKDLMKAIYSDKWYLNYVVWVTPQQEGQLSLGVFYLGNNKYEVTGLDFGDKAEKQYDLIYALLKDVTESPDEIYKMLKERSELAFKGWNNTDGYTQEYKTWRASHENTTERIGNVNFTWGEYCDNFIIEKAS